MLPKPTRKKPKKSRWGSKAEYMKVCYALWEQANRQCQKCSKPIPTPRWHNFNHTAGRRENFCNPKYIEVICFSCHSLYHGIPEKNGDWLDTA